MFGTAITHKYDNHINLIGWFVVGFLLFLVSNRVASPKSQLTYGDLIMGLIFSIIGPFGIFALVLAAAMRLSNTPIFKK